MSKCNNMQYRSLGEKNLNQDYSSTKYKFFFCGFIVAIILTILSEAVFQILSSNTVVVSNGSRSYRWPDPPPHKEVAKVARYVVHISEWASIATTSTAEPIKGYPFGNIISISDGPRDTGSGTPYVYITYMDLTGKDLLKDRRVTLSLSEAQSDYCQKHDLDPEDPQCARVLLSGTMEEVKNGTREADFARTALFSRHPAMALWPSDHHWVFLKLDITHIYVLDFYGGANEVDVADYYNA